MEEGQATMKFTENGGAYVQASPVNGYRCLVHNDAGVWINVASTTAHFYSSSQKCQPCSFSPPINASKSLGSETHAGHLATAKRDPWDPGFPQISLQSGLSSQFAFFSARFVLILEKSFLILRYRQGTEFASFRNFSQEAAACNMKELWNDKRMSDLQLRSWHVWQRLGNLLKRCQGFQL
jgi:hypothetical protein